MLAGMSYRWMSRLQSVLCAAKNCCNQSSIDAEPIEFHPILYMSMARRASFSYLYLYGVHRHGAVAVVVPFMLFFRQFLSYCFNSFPIYL